MKRFFLILLAFTAFPFFAAAQSLDRALEQLEAARMKNGEQSQEYLSVLDTVILKANMAGETPTAFTYREKHLDLVKKMKGNESVEVADDLWRLGNTSCMLGDTVAGLDYYTQAAEVFEKSINLKKNYDYIQHYDACLYFILQILVSEKDQEGVSYYSTKFNKLSEETKGANSYSHIDDLITTSQFNFLVGNIDDAILYGERAEKMLIDKYASNEELYNDQMYYKVVNLLALKHFIKADYVSGMTYYQRVCNILEHNNMMDSKEYYDALTYLVHCAYNAGEYAFVIKNAPKLEPMVFKYSDTPIEDAYLYVAYMGDAKAKSGEYKEAIYYYDEAMGLLPQLLSGSPLIVSQIQTLVARAEALNMAGEKGDAITCLTEAKWKLEKLDESADTKSLKAQILSIEGQLVPVFQDAMACFDSALLLNQSLLANAQLESDNDYVIHMLKYRQGVFLLNKGMIQFYNGVATDAINAFTTSASIFQTA